LIQLIKIDACASFTLLSSMVDQRAGNRITFTTGDTS